jgi:hypothetical protein
VIEKILSWRTREETRGSPNQMKSVVLVPPLNFSIIDPGIYRSGYPNAKKFLSFSLSHEK